MTNFVKLSAACWKFCDGYLATSATGRIISDSNKNEEESGNITESVS